MRDNGKGLEHTSVRLEVDLSPELLSRDLARLTKVGILLCVRLSLTWTSSPHGVRSQKT